MKTIFNDPVFWSKSVVGSKLSFGLMIACHLSVGLYLIYLLGFSPFIIVLLIFGVLYPILYLNAIRKLLILNENKSQ